MKHYHKTLKNSLLVTALGACVTLPTASATDAEDFATPNRNAEREERVQRLALTEGQKVSLKQAEVLNYQRLRGALGDDFFSFATKYFGTTDEAEMATQWDAIFNVNIPYNDAKKRNVLKRVKDIFDKFSGERTVNYLLASDDFSRLCSSIDKVPLTRIEESTRGYFESLFQGSKVATSWKRGGDQLGCVAEVTLPNGQVLTYFVKTHSGGLRSGHSSAAKLVNPSELLVYKVLEGLGIGPQSHFFGRDGHNLYIATLDAGMQLSADGTITQVPFKEYEYFKNDQQDPSVQAQLWGDLSQLPTDVDFSAAQHIQAEALVNAESGIARNFVHEVAKLDVIARIMRLTDFQTNPGNYGFAPGPDGKLKSRAIDFRLNSTDPNEIRFGEYFFKGFLDGNGYFDYSSTGKAMYYSLRKRQQHLRVQEAQIIMERELQEFEAVVDRASKYVSGTLSTQIPMTENDQASRQIELAQYAEIIKANFKRFKNQLQQYTPPMPSE